MTLRVLSDYGRGFQLKVLGALLTHKEFLLNVRDVLKVEYWDAPAHQWIVNEILKYWDQYHTTVTMEVLKIEFKKIENEVLKVAVKEELKNSYEASQEDLAYVEEEFTLFCRNQEMKRAILASAEKLKSNDFEGIRTLVENALKAGADKGIGHEYEKDIETRYRDDYRPTIPTPWEPINTLFSGGSGPGDLFLIFGGPGTGKTWLSIACAANAVQLGYNVNYYTLELGENYVARRFDSYFTGYSVEECKERRSEVEAIVSNLPGKLTIKEYAPKTATFSTLEAHVQKCMDEGKKPDLIVIDYLDYMKPVSGHYSERLDEINNVIVGGKSFAKSLGIPVISPSQVNRSGAKDQVVEGDKAAGSYEKIMVSDMSISLSRQKEDKVLGTGRIHIMKNRYGEDGMTFNVRFDTNNGHLTFDEDQPATQENQSVSSAFNLDKNMLSKFFNTTDN